MVIVNKFDSNSFNQLPNLSGRVLYDTTLNLLRFNNSQNYNNIIVTKDLTNNIENINNLTVDGNLNLVNHDRTQNMGLVLNGELVTATAEELNYNQVVEGIATASKALVLDYNKDITGINSLSLNSLTASTLKTTGNVGINTDNLTFGLQVNESAGNCLRLIYNTSTGGPTNKCDFKLTATGSLIINPSGTNPTVSIPANISGVTLSLTKQNAANNTIDYPLSLTVLPSTLAEQNLGVGIEFNTLNDNYDIITLGTFDMYGDNLTNNNECGVFRWMASNNGVLVDVAELDFEGHFYCNTIATTNLTETSDLRLKKDVRDINITESYNNILQLQPKDYIFKNDINNKLHSGLIAQDVKEIFPHLVEVLNTEEMKDMYVIKYTSLIPHLINCIKKLDDELTNVKYELEYLKNK